MLELVAGANAALPPGPTRLRLAGPFDLSALVLGPSGRVDGDADFVFYNQPGAPGLRLSAGGPAGDELLVDVARLRPRAARVVLVASPEDGVTPFGRLPAPVTTLHDAAGTTLMLLRPPPLRTETALVLAEVYQRAVPGGAGGWKVRAVGQGYADGLAGLARDFGVDVAEQAPAPVPAARRPEPARPVPPAQARPAPSRPRQVPVPPGARQRLDQRAPAPAPAPRVPVPDADSRRLAEVVALTNAQRAQHGLGPLTAEPRIGRAAHGHSADMARRHFFDHTNPDGKDVADRVNAQGYPYRVVAENIAAGQRTPQEVVTGWMNSPGHRRNILLPDITHIGVGYVESTDEYGRYWTQVFGAPRDW